MYRVTSQPRRHSEALSQKASQPNKKPTATTKPKKKKERRREKNIKTEMVPRIVCVLYLGEGMTSLTSQQEH